MDIVKLHAPYLKKKKKNEAGNTEQKWICIRIAECEECIRDI